MKKITVICDDKKAINSCKALDIKSTTALNILEELYKKKIIPKNKATKALEALKKYGWYNYRFTDVIEKQLRGE